MITPAELGRRVATAIDEASGDVEGVPLASNRKLVAVLIGKSKDSLDNYIKGKGEGPGAITVAKIAELTGKPFGWFAGERDSAPERLATVAERAERDIQVIEERLKSLLAELSAARRVVAANDVKVARAASRGSRAKRAEELDKPVAVAGEPAS